MGIAWIQVFKDQIIHQFLHKFKTGHHHTKLNWLQSYRLFVHALAIVLFIYIQILNLLYPNTNPFYTPHTTLTKFTHTTIGLFGTLFLILSNHTPILSYFTKFLHIVIISSTTMLTNLQKNIQILLF